MSDRYNEVQVSLRTDISLKDQLARMNVYQRIRIRFKWDSGLLYDQAPNYNGDFLPTKSRDFVIQARHFSRLQIGWIALNDGTRPYFDGDDQKLVMWEQTGEPRRLPKGVPRDQESYVLLEDTQRVGWAGKNLDPDLYGKKPIYGRKWLSAVHRPRNCKYKWHLQTYRVDTKGRRHRTPLESVETREQAIERLLRWERYLMKGGESPAAIAAEITDAAKIVTQEGKNLKAGFREAPVDAYRADAMQEEYDWGDIREADREQVLWHVVRLYRFAHDAPAARPTMEALARWVVANPPVEWINAPDVVDCA